MQHKRRGNARKSDAHFGRVLAYGSRSSALAFGVAPTGIEEVREDCSRHITWTYDTNTHIASGKQLAPPGSAAGRGNIGGKELGRILSKPVYAGLEIQDAPKPVSEDGYEKVTVQFVDESKHDVKTQMVFETTMVGAVTARGLEWSMYDIYLCTDSNVYWRGWGKPSMVNPPFQ